MRRGWWRKSGERGKTGGERRKRRIEGWWSREGGERRRESGGEGKGREREREKEAGDEK